MSGLGRWVRGVAAAGLVVIVIAAGCADRQLAEGRPKTPAVPNSPVVSPQGEACDSATTQLAMTACQAQAAKEAEALEEERYAAAEQTLKTKGAMDQLALLKAAEQAWEHYRDAECQAAAGLYGGGSMAPMVVAVCRARLANQRSAELKVVYLDRAVQ